MIGTAEERAEADRRHELVRMACAEVGIPIATGRYHWAAHGRRIAVGYVVPEQHRTVARRSLALALMRAESPSSLMQCRTHSRASDHRYCLLVTAAEVARDPTTTCGAP